MTANRRGASPIFDNPILIGAITILIASVAVYLSYISENGLPFVPSYNVKVQVANGDEVVKNADVRIGGTRVGQVLGIAPEPATRSYPHPVVQLQLQLQKSLEPLPRDTRYQIRVASVLGGKYLELIPGTGRGAGIPDGGTLTIAHENPVVDLDTAFDVFGPRTRSGLRGLVKQLGDAVAGRGSQFNDAIYSLHRLVGPLDRVLRLLSSPRTQLARFISGAAATTGALAPVAPVVSSLLADGATTFAALDVPALGQTIDELPPTESLATGVLTGARPVLADVATLVQELKPSATLLPRAAHRLGAVLRAATPVFERVPRTAALLGQALTTVDRLALDDASWQTFKVLGSSDLATFGGSAFVGLGATLKAVAPSQLACNVAGIWARNIASEASEGDTAGTWLRFIPIINFSESILNAKPSSDLHANPYPVESARQCQAGNEPYALGQRIGPPASPTSTTVDNTTPPPGVLQRGAAAGLVP